MKQKKLMPLLPKNNIVVIIIIVSHLKIVFRLYFLKEKNTWIDFGIKTTE